MAYRVILKKNEEKRVLAGHSWVYANEAAKIEGKDKNGSLAEVYAHDGRFIGKGYINHLSKILVRIFIRGQEEDGEELYRARIAEAGALREKLFDPAQNNCCRLVFAEADDLPALIIDRYADYFVLECLSLGVDQRKKVIADALVSLYSPKGIYKNGQKTGYFLDQKENRFAVRRYCRDARVLDCFCNSGGFSLNAATVAKEVTALDISPFALENVEENARLNGFVNIKTECADVFDALRQYRAEGKKFGCVILDPPAFCKSAAEVKDAYRGYKDINISAMKLVERGGFLVSCSCSHYMTAPLFEKMLRESAFSCGRQAKLLETRVQAPDHPTLLAAEETSYLKVFIMQVK